jgi:hypothetical protein
MTIVRDRDKVPMPWMMRRLKQDAL